jgi:hypothetical protein
VATKNQVNFYFFFLKESMFFTLPFLLDCCVQGECLFLCVPVAFDLGLALADHPGRSQRPLSNGVIGNT